MNRYNNKNTSTNVNKIKKSKSLPNDTRNKSTTYSPRNQSDSSDVFNNKSDDFEFQTKTKKSKHNLSSTSSSINKKNKTAFTSPNKYVPFATNDVNDTTVNDIDIDNEQITQSPSSPPIFARGNFNFIELRKDLINLIGSQIFFFKSSVKNLKFKRITPSHIEQ
jgi:hypothetical protein